MVPPVVISEREMDGGPGNLAAGKHQGELKNTPSHPTLPSEHDRSYELDESVKACGFVSLFGLIPTDCETLSFPSPGNEISPHPQVWHILVGKDCTDNRRTTRRRRSKILPQGRRSLHKEDNS